MALHLTRVGLPHVVRSRLLVTRWQSDGNLSINVVQKRSNLGGFWKYQESYNAAWWHLWGQMFSFLSSFSLILLINLIHLIEIIENIVHICRRRHSVRWNLWEQMFSFLSSSHSPVPGKWCPLLFSSIRLRCGCISSTYLQKGPKCLCDCRSGWGWEFNFNLHNSHL